MNCWNTLRASQNHNVTGNSERDGMKICRIGQSAAKSLQGLEPTNMVADSIDFFDSFNGEVFPSTGHQFVALDTSLGLKFLPLNKRKGINKQIVSEGIVENDFVSSFAGFEFSELNVPICLMGDKFNSLPFAHSDFNNHTELKSMSCSFRSREFSNTDTTFPINNSGNISSNGWFHNKTSRLTFNDYPYGEYAQVSGRMQQSHHTIEATDDIVFSSVKAEAAGNHQPGGTGNNEPVRKYKAYLGDDYYALAWPTTLRSFKNNLETIHQYSDTGFKLIMNGEIGRYENVRYVEQTNIAKGIGTTGISTANGGDMTAWAKGNSDWIFFFGNDTVAEAIATPEEMRGKIPTDYGRSKGVAWYYLGGFGIVHSLASNCRIVKWDSLA